MLLLLIKSQLGLFAAPVHIAGSIRKDGTIIAPHTGIRMKRIAKKPAAAAPQGALFADEQPEAPAAESGSLGRKLAAWIKGKGGVAEVARLLAGMPQAQQDKLIEMMATLGGVTAAQVRQVLGAGAPAAAAAPAPAEPDLFSQPAASAAPTPETPTAHVPEPAEVPQETEAAPGAQGATGEQEAAEVKQPADEPPHHPMTEPKGMHRSVSPEEWEHIKRTGAITGGSNSFNGFDPRKDVFFGPEASKQVIGQGEDITRRAEYQVQNGPLQKKLEKVISKMDKLKSDRKDLEEELRSDGRSDAGIRYHPEMKKLRLRIVAVQQELTAIHTEGRAAISDRIKQLREQDEARGYTSVVLETRPIDGGRRYTGKHSGMKDEDEFGFDPGHVKLSDITRVRYMRDGEQVREEPGPAAAAEQGPREGERNADGLVFRDGRWHRDEVAATPAGVYRDFDQFEADTQKFGILANMAANLSGMKPGDWSTHGATLGDVLDALKQTASRDWQHKQEMENPAFAHAYRSVFGDAWRVAADIRELDEQNPKLGILQKVRGPWALDLINVLAGGGKNPNLQNYVSDSKPYAKIRKPKAPATFLPTDTTTKGKTLTGAPHERVRQLLDADDIDGATAVLRGLTMADLKSSMAKLGMHSQTGETKARFLERIAEVMPRQTGTARARQARIAALDAAGLAFREAKRNHGMAAGLTHDGRAVYAPDEALMADYAGKMDDARAKFQELAAAGDVPPTVASRYADLMPAPPARPAPFGVPAGISKGARRDINARVASMVQHGEVNLELMRQYSGNGGCGDSLNEFYTDPEVASAMWAVAGRLGYTSGTALEPSCATGVFLHTAPAGFRVTGVEMDPISQACAAALHGDRHEIAAPQSLERFVHNDGGRQFKVTIGNPPYGPRGALARDDKRELKSAETYFIDTALDKTEPGGLCMLVVPASVLNNKGGRSFRERMLRKAEFLGAQRMPNSAFEASHTDVTADVIYLRKRPDDVAGALMTVDKSVLKKIGVWDDEFLAGGYFEGRGAGNVFGKVGTAMRAFGEIYTVDGSMAGVPERIAAFEPHPVGKTPGMQDVLSALEGDEAATKRAMGGALVRPYADHKIGDTKTEDGVTYILQGDPPRWHRVDEFVAQRPAVVDAAPLAAMIERAMRGESVDHAALADGVKAWVGRYGIPGKHADLGLAASADKSLYRLIGAVSEDGKLSDVVLGKQAEQQTGSFDTIANALALETESGTFTAEALAKRTGQDADEVADTLFAMPEYAYLGGGEFAPMSQYLTGELWPKLDQVRRDLASDSIAPEARAKYTEQAKRLEATIDPKSLEDVEINLNSAFLPLPVLEAFFNWKQFDSDEANEWTKKQQPVKISFDNGVYSIAGGNTWGTSKLMDKHLNRTGVRKEDLGTIEDLNQSFREWLLASKHRDEVEDLYNRKFRGFVQQKFGDGKFDIPGLAADDLNPYQYSGLRWALATGKGIIAADVGLGKTVRGLMLARMLKVTGKAKKPTFVVPKSVLANWVAESQKWFPGSRVMVIGETYSMDRDGKLKSKPDGKAERDRKFHELTQNDYDFVFISRPTFNDLDLNPVLKGQYVDQDFWVQRGDQLGNAGDKRVKRVREQYQQAMADREFLKRTDAIYFDQLGIDALITDEAHAYKNLYAAKARFGESPKYLGGQGLSNQAFDMNLKARFVRENNKGKNIFSLTATPTKNSPLEIYSMLAPIAPEAFERIGIRNSEEFLDRFCEFKQDWSLGTDGVIEHQLVTSGFKNLDELREIMGQYIDRTTAADVGLKLPARDDRMHLVDMDPSQHAVYSDLRAQLEEAGKKDATGDAHIFSIMNKMGKAALDLELLDPEAYKGHVSQKYKAVAKQVRAGVEEGGQVVFCEAIESHEKMVSALVKSGIPRDQIAILNGQTAPSSAERQNISDKFNAGKLKVVIGNKTMEEGVNLQKATTDIHHLDLPWDPATFQQRNGRGLRQGNKNAAVRIHTYLSKQSFDGYRHQSMSAKQDWMDMLWKGGNRVENLSREGVVSREDLMIMMSADPDAERAKLAADKEAAISRHEAGKRADATSEFVRFQAMKRSFKALKNKDTASAARLSNKLEAARTSLSKNRYFGAKAALDANDDVLIHPDTHEMLTRDVGIEVSEADGSKSRWVVTGVDPVKNEVGMRRYADTTGSKGVTTTLEKLASGTKTFSLDKAAESDEIRQHMERAAVAKIEGVEKLRDVQQMPPHVIEANYDLLQRRLKDAASNYKLDANGNVAMVEKATGKVSTMAYYSAMKAHDTHDYALPIQAHRDAAIQQWVDERRNARIGSRYVDRPGARRGKGQSYSPQDRKLAREHNGSEYTSKHINPMRDVLNTMDGVQRTYNTDVDGPSVKAAKAQLEREQMIAVKNAKTFYEALSAAMPLASVGSDKITYKPRLLALLWAKAKRAGVLNEPLINHAGSGGSLPHTSEAYGGGQAHRATVAETLMSMAEQGSKSGGLVPAMSRVLDDVYQPGQPQKYREHIASLVGMADGFGHDADTRIAAAKEALRVAEKVGAAGIPKRNYLGGGSYGYSSYGSTGLSEMKPLRQYLSDKIDEIERIKAHSAASKAALKEAA
ncbi:MAG: SNF2-related protein [Leptothrix sp. (in: b-proteobacteria)]